MSKSIDQAVRELMGTFPTIAPEGQSLAMVSRALVDRNNNIVLPADNLAGYLTAIIQAVIDGQNQVEWAGALEATTSVDAEAAVFTAVALPAGVFRLEMDFVAAAVSGNVMLPLVAVSGAGSESKKYSAAFIAYELANGAVATILGTQEARDDDETGATFNFGTLDAGTSGVSVVTFHLVAGMLTLPEGGTLSITSAAAGATHSFKVGTQYLIRKIGDA